MDSPEVFILDRMEPGVEELELVQILEARGLTARLVDWQHINFVGNPPSVESYGKPVRIPKVAILRSRVLTRHTEGDVAFLYDWLEMFEGMGTTLINTLDSVRRSQNKVYSISLLARAGIRVPQTRAARSVEDVGKCVSEWKDVVLKPIYGHGSVDMVRLLRDPLVEENYDEELVVWNLLKQHRVLCAQQFISNPGRDLRVVVVRGKVVDSQYRIARSPDERVKDLINPYAKEPAVCTPEIRELATNSCQVLGLDCASIDMLESPGGPVVIEVNPTISIWRNTGGDGKSIEGGVGMAFAEMVVEAVGNTDALVQKNLRYR